MKQNRFQKNTDILTKYFADINKMDGIIVKIEVEEPYINYAEAFGNPMREQTLQLADTNNSTILFYKADHRVPKRSIMKGVTVMTSYKLTEDDMVRKLMPPAAIPKNLENHIFANCTYGSTSEISHALKRVQLKSSVTERNKPFFAGSNAPSWVQSSRYGVPACLACQLFCIESPVPAQSIGDLNSVQVPTKLSEFLNTHFVHGNMTPLSVVTSKPGWHKSFRNFVNVKVVSICRSCRKKANKNCCAEYNSANRTTVLMVLGWDEK